MAEGRGADALRPFAVSGGSHGRGQTPGHAAVHHPGVDDQDAQDAQKK